MSKGFTVTISIYWPESELTICYYTINNLKLHFGILFAVIFYRSFILNGSIENKELTMNTIFLFLIGIAALSGLLAVMIYLLAVSREMESPDGDEI